MLRYINTETNLDDGKGCGEKVHAPFYFFRRVANAIPCNPRCKRGLVRGGEKPVDYIYRSAKALLLNVSGALPLAVV